MRSLPLPRSVAPFVLLTAIHSIVPLRVSAEEETEALDLVLHGESGYNL